jgi:hypothetical protein
MIEWFLTNQGALMERRPFAPLLRTGGAADGLNRVILRRPHSLKNEIVFDFAPKKPSLTHRDVCQPVPREGFFPPVERLS